MVYMYQVVIAPDHAVKHAFPIVKKGVQERISVAFEHNLAVTVKIPFGFRMGFNGINSEFVIPLQTINETFHGTG